MRPINNASAVRLEGTMSPRARAELDRGPVAATTPLERMTVVFSRTAEQQAALDQLLAEQQDPASLNYHKWLTPEEFADRFGLAQADVDLVSAWLTSQGFTVTEVARSRTWVAFSGIAAQVEAAFRAPIHNYLANGVMHYAASTDVAVPDAFSGVITGVTGLHNFAPRPLNVKPRPKLTSSVTGNHFIVPGDFATIYNLPSYSNGQPCVSPCNDGTGQTIAIVGQSQPSTDTNPGHNNQYDLVTFRGLAGLPALTSVTFQIKLKGTDPGVVTSDVDETNLDLEWSGAAAPNATLIYYIENPNANGAFQAMVDAVNANVASVISVSYGECETQAPSSDLTLLTNAGIQAQAAGTSHCRGLRGRWCGGLRHQLCPAHKASRSISPAACLTQPPSAAQRLRGTPPIPPPRAKLRSTGPGRPTTRHRLPSRTFRRPHGTIPAGLQPARSQRLGEGPAVPQRIQITNVLQVFRSQVGRRGPASLMTAYVTSLTSRSMPLRRTISSSSVRSRVA